MQIKSFCINGKRSSFTCWTHSIYLNWVRFILFSTPESRFPLISNKAVRHPGGHLTKIRGFGKDGILANISMECWRQVFSVMIEHRKIARCTLVYVPIFPSFSTQHPYKSGTARGVGWGSFSPPPPRHFLVALNNNNDKVGKFISQFFELMMFTAQLSQAKPFFITLPKRRTFWSYNFYLIFTRWR